MSATGSPTAEAAHFDWTGAHARLARALEKLETAANPTPAQIQEVLRERARRYAAARRTRVAQSFTEVVGFSIGEDRFAIEIGQGAAVTPLNNLTTLPGIPSFYLGLISHRGHIFPVIDPRPLLGVKRTGGCAAHYAVLVRGERSAIGLAAEEIQGVTRFRADEIAAVDSETARFRAVQGVGPRDTMIIDCAILMQDARLLVDDQPLIAAN
jgi:chemotaxis signal transduction protein